MYAPTVYRTRNSDTAPKNVSETLVRHAGKEAERERETERERDTLDGTGRARPPLPASSECECAGSPGLQDPGAPLERDSENRSLPRLNSCKSPTPWRQATGGQRGHTHTDSRHNTQD